MQDTEERASDQTMHQRSQLRLQSKYPHDMASNSRGNDALNVANVKLIGSMPSSLLERSDQRLVSLRFGTRMMSSFSALEL